MTRPPIMLLFFFLLTKLCRASCGSPAHDPYYRDLLFSLDQHIQALSKPLDLRFETLPVRNKARKDVITRAWQDIFGSQAKVHFPDKLDNNAMWRRAQLNSWHAEDTYLWQRGPGGILSRTMYFVGFSTLQPQHLRLHSIIVTLIQNVCDFSTMEWCEKPFWSNTSTCKMRTKLSSKEPGFLVKPCIQMSRIEAKAIQSRASFDAVLGILKHAKLPSVTLLGFRGDQNYEN